MRRAVLAIWMPGFGVAVTWVLSLAWVCLRVWVYLGCCWVDARVLGV